MTILIAAGILTVTWCLLLVWVVRIALGRGRSGLVWGLVAGGIGILAVIGGFQIAAALVDNADVDMSAVRTAFAMFVPLFALILSMVAVGFVVQRESIKVSEKGSWPVSFMGMGNGSISFNLTRIQIAIGTDVREVTSEQLHKVEADGECVRLSLAAAGGGDEELIAMPMGKPATPAGRRHQSLVLAKRLRAR